VSQRGVELVLKLPQAFTDPLLLHPRLTQAQHQLRPARSEIVLEKLLKWSNPM
jgi:hypothetical protein